MGIDDTKFNMLFSFRCISTMLLPFVFPYLLDHIGIQTTSLILSISAFLGQYLFILGLERKSYNILLLSRLVFGLSDC